VRQKTDTQTTRNSKCKSLQRHKKKTTKKATQDPYKNRNLSEESEESEQQQNNENTMAPQNQASEALREIFRKY
jgi:ribonuclease HI